jgi:3-hydroxy acid dehydrogenase/malonic semialdehyde reductase
MAETSVRNAVVTGAAGGMGRAITEALLESGRRVVLVDRDPESLRQFAAKMGDSTFPIQLDITDAKSVDRLPDLIPNAFKPVDNLINNAGHDIGGRTRFDIGPADDWSGIIQTNLIGLMRVTRSILPDMVKRNSGHIVNISSINAVRIIPDMAARTSKAGVHMFTETLRGELAETAIGNRDAARPDANRYHPHPLPRRQEERERLLRPVQDGARSGRYRTIDRVCAGPATPCSDCGDDDSARKPLLNQCR